MYSFSNLESVCCSMSCFNCCFLTCIQVSQEAGKVFWYSQFFFFLIVVDFVILKQPWVYMCSPSRSPLPPPSPTDPSRSSQYTRSERLSHASNLGWWSVSPQIISMCRCCSLETSHPLLLPQSLKDCSIHLYLFFCFAYRVIITIFLNSIYMC